MLYARTVVSEYLLRQSLNHYKGNIMGKLKQLMIEQQEQYEAMQRDMTSDEIIAEDIYFRYGIDLPEAIQAHNLMSLTAPPADLYVTHPELYSIWLKRFTDDDPYFQQQLDLFYGEHGFGEAIYGE